MDRLEKMIEASSPNILPFMVKDRVVEHLKETSFDFQKLCDLIEFQSYVFKGRPYIAIRDTVSMIKSCAPIILLSFSGFGKPTNIHQYLLCTKPSKLRELNASEYIC